jgi:hypothetical protein
VVSATLDSLRAGCKRVQNAISSFPVAAPDVLGDGDVAMTPWSPVSRPTRRVT